MESLNLAIFVISALLRLKILNLVTLISYVAKNHPNFLYPILILRNRSHAKRYYIVRDWCQTRFIESILSIYSRREQDQMSKQPFYNVTIACYIAKTFCLTMGWNPIKRSMKSQIRKLFCQKKKRLYLWFYCNFKQFSCLINCVLLRVQPWKSLLKWNSLSIIP